MAWPRLVDRAALSQTAVGMRRTRRCSPTPPAPARARKQTALPLWSGTCRTVRPQTIRHSEPQGQRAVVGNPRHAQLATRRFIPAAQHEELITAGVPPVLQSLLSINFVSISQLPHSVPTTTLHVRQPVVALHFRGVALMAVHPASSVLARFGDTWIRRIRRIRCSKPREIEFAKRRQQGRCYF